MLTVVALTRFATRDLVCTGTLIDRDIVLTAGHCLCRPTEITGDAFVGDNLRGPGLFYFVKSKRGALASCAESRKTGLDLAVARLANPVEGVTPVKFASDALIAKATSFRVVGFGAIDRQSSTLTYEKREAPVASVSSDCRGSVNGSPLDRFYQCQAGREIVAGRRRGPDTCGGDSGGPLFVAADGTAGSPSSSTLMLAGVTSRAVGAANPPCGSGGVYERLTPEARDWIQRTIKILRRPAAAA